MTAKRVGIALLAFLVMLAPLAAAHAEDSGNDDGSADRLEEGENAWVEDCPPEMMCALGVEDEGENAWVEDCPPEMMCALDDPNAPVDNTTWGTDCPPGLYCMDGPTEGPVCAGGLCAYDAEPAEEEAAVEEASLAVVALSGLLATLALVFVAALRRH